MSLTSDGARRMVRLSGGWGCTVSLGGHIPPRESCDIKSSQLVPLTVWVASDIVDKLVNVECCDGALPPSWLSRFFFLNRKGFLLRLGLYSVNRNPDMFSSRINK
jgi:hypothetical protein